MLYVDNIKASMNMSTSTSSFRTKPQTLSDISTTIQDIQRQAHSRKKQLYSSEKKLLTALDDLQRELKTWSEKHLQYPIYELRVRAWRDPAVLQIELFTGQDRLAHLHTGQSFVFFDDQPEEPVLDPQSPLSKSTEIVNSTGENRKEIHRINANTQPEQYVKWIEHYFGKHILCDQAAKQYRILLNVSTNLQI